MASYDLDYDDGTDDVCECCGRLEGEHTFACRHFKEIDDVLWGIWLDEADRAPETAGVF